MYLRVSVNVLLTLWMVAILSVATVMESPKGFSMKIPVDSLEREELLPNAVTGTTTEKAPRVGTGSEAKERVTGETTGPMTVAEQCTAGTKPHVKGRLWRNPSGDWTATAHMEQSAHSHAQRPALELEAEPSLRRCGGLNVLALTLTVRGTGIAPGPGYEKTKYVGSFYKVHKDKKHWEDAKIKCEQENAHLLVLNSQQEADEIVELLRKHKVAGDHLHIGFRDIGRGQYRTIFGETLAKAGFEKWQTSQPSSIGEQNCGSIWPSTAQLNDIKCTGQARFFICEQPA